MVDTKKGFFEVVPPSMVWKMRNGAEDMYELPGRLDRISLGRDIGPDDVIAFYEQYLIDAQRTSYLARDLDYPAVFDATKGVLREELEEVMQVSPKAIHPNLIRIIKTREFILGEVREK